MTARFPQSASSVAWRIKPAWASKILVMYWGATADSVHRLRSSDTASTVLTRAASGATFNSTTGLIEGNATTYFTDSNASGYGSLLENSDYTLGVSYYGDLYNGIGAAEKILIGTNTPPDSSDSGGKFYSENYGVFGGPQNTSGGFLANLADDVPSAIIAAMRNNQSDATAKQRIWQNGAELTGQRLNVVPSSSSAIGTTARPIYFGANFTGTGNTKLWFEMVFLGTGALTDADLVAITADPSILVEAMPADTTAPTLVSAVVANATPTVVNLTMSEAMDTGSVPATSAFTVSGHTVSSVAISGITINLTCSAAFVYGEAARTVGYTQPGSNKAQDLAAPPNLLANFSAQAIVNNVAAVATGVTMTGPTSGVTGTASTNFTVGVTPVGGTISGTVIVTPSDGGAGGTFTPTTKSLTNASPTGTFTYTAASAGAKTISLNNNGGLTNPSNITYTASSTAATATVVTGPTTGTVSVASSSFTASANGTITGTVIITPADGGAGGTFSPTTVSISSGSPSATFTYTAASAGAKTISFTNNGSLTNQGNLTYTASASSIVTFAYSAPGKGVMGNLRTSVAHHCTVHHKVTRALLATKTGLTSDGTTGAVSFNLAASGTIVAATEYLLMPIADDDDYDFGTLWVTTT